MNLRDLIEGQRRKYKESDPEGYKRAKDRGRFFGIGAVVAGVLIMWLVVSCQSQAASFTFDGGASCIDYTWDPADKKLSCVYSGTPTPPVTPPVTPPGGGGGDFAGCPAGALTINHGTSTANAVYTQGWGGQVLSIRVVPLATTTTAQIRVNEYIDPAYNRVLALSLKPCSTEAADAIQIGRYPAVAPVGIGPGISYTTTPNSKQAASVTPGQPFYVNIKTPNCGGSCNAVVTIGR